MIGKMIGKNWQVTKFGRIMRRNIRKSYLNKHFVKIVDNIKGTKLKVFFFFAALLFC